MKTPTIVAIIAWAIYGAIEILRMCQVIGDNYSSISIMNIGSLLAIGSMLYFFVSLLIRQK